MIFVKYTPLNKNYSLVIFPMEKTVPSCLRGLQTSLRNGKNPYKEQILISLGHKRDGGRLSKSRCILSLYIVRKFLELQFYVYANLSKKFVILISSHLYTCTSFSLLSSTRFRPGLDPSGQYSFSSFLQGKPEVQIPHVELFRKMRMNHPIALDLMRH